MSADQIKLTEMKGMYLVVIEVQASERVGKL